MENRQLKVKCNMILKINYGEGEGRKKEQEQQVPAAELLLAPASGVPEPPGKRGIQVQEPVIVQSQETYWLNLFVCVWCWG